MFASTVHLFYRNYGTGNFNDYFTLSKAVQCALHTGIHQMFINIYLVDNKANLN